MAKQFYIYECTYNRSISNMNVNTFGYYTIYMP
jgi:hypothetical protein